MADVLPVDTRLPPNPIVLWAELVNACEKLLLAGLRREIGPVGDLTAAHRRWYAEQMEEHDRMMLHMIAALSRQRDVDAR